MRATSKIIIASRGGHWPKGSIGPPSNVRCRRAERSAGSSCLPAKRLRCYSAVTAVVRAICASVYDGNAEEVCSVAMPAIIWR